MSHRLSVSVAMTTYNGARFLRQQLASLACQSRLPAELVVCDDGSVDGTLQILNEFAATSRIKVSIFSNHARLGVSGNFQKALMLSVGEVVMISDQDDIWYPNKVDRVLQLFESDARRNYLCVVNDANIVDGNLNASGKTLGAQILNARGTDRDLVAGCCTSVRRSLIEWCFPMPDPAATGMGYDEYIHLCSRFLAARRVEREALQSYRRHATNVSQSAVYHQPRSILARARWFQNRLQALGSPQFKGEWLSQQLAIAQCLQDRASTKRISFRLSNTHIRCLDRVKSTLELRIVMNKKPRFRRIPTVLKLLALGRYRSFSGLKSALSDLL